jgi:hypothetical protein
MSHPINNRVREALVVAALFGGVGLACAQAPASNDGNIQSSETPQVPGHDGVEEPSAKQAAVPQATGIFVNGTLNVPNAPKDTATVPAKFSAGNDQLDHLPIMARGPALSAAQRKLILDRLGTPDNLAPAHLAAGPASELPANVAMQPWPADITAAIPDIGATKFVRLPDKILVVRPESRTVIDEIRR